MSTRRSLGIESTTVRWFFASTWTRRMVSDRCPGEFFVVPNCFGTPLRLSLPRMRKTHRLSRHWWVIGRQSWAVQLGEVSIWMTLASTWRIVAMAKAELADATSDSTPARTNETVLALVLRGRWEASLPISLGAQRTGPPRRRSGVRERD